MRCPPAAAAAAAPGKAVGERPWPTRSCNKAESTEVALLFSKKGKENENHNIFSPLFYLHERRHPVVRELHDSEVKRPRKLGLRTGYTSSALLGTCV